MKIPSFVRVPKYKRFNFEPRHYDPVKDEIKNRTEKIQNELKNLDNGTPDEFAMRQRISEAFVRDKHRTGGKVNGLQLALVFLLSATFVGFLYIGFYALFITGVIILIYVLFQLGVFKSKPLPVDTISKTTEESPVASRIAAGGIREGHYFYRERSANKKGMYKLLILSAAVGVAAAYYILQLNGIMCLLIIFILLILFIKESNKAQ